MNRFSDFSDEELGKLADEALDRKKTMSVLAKRSLRDDLATLNKNDISGCKELMDSLEKNDMVRFASLWKLFREQLEKLSASEKESLKDEITAMDHAIQQIEEFGQHLDD